MRDDVNLSTANLPSKINVSVLVTTDGEDPKTVEKFLLVNIRDKRDFNVSLTDNKVTINEENRIHRLFLVPQILESSRWNNSIGSFLLENALGNYTVSLIDDSSGRFKLKGTQLIVRPSEQLQSAFMSRSGRTDLSRELRSEPHVSVRS